MCAATPLILPVLWSAGLYFNVTPDCQNIPTHTNTQPEDSIRQQTVSFFGGGNILGVCTVEFDKLHVGSDPEQTHTHSFKLLFLMTVLLGVDLLSLKCAILRYF